MIVAMQHLDLVCLAAERTATLERLRELGVVHLELGAPKGEAYAAARGEAEAAEAAVRIILKARGEVETEERRAKAVSEVLELDADRQRLKDAVEALRLEYRQYEPWGDFDPELAARLLKRVPELRDYVDLPAELPEQRLSRLVEKLERLEHRLKIDVAKLATADEKAILAKYPAIADKIAFEAAREAMTATGQVAVLSGWVPAPQVAELRTAAAANGWGMLLREPAAGETPPTLIEPPRLFRPAKVLFAGLGIAPAYTESDVSVPFLAYFAVFFAMLVGDGAYGLIFLAGTLALRKRLPRAWLILLTAFSVSTVGWGILSNTWFGAHIPWCENWPTVVWLADPSYNHMMLLCFTIGVTHLVLARLWNFACKLNDTTCLAELGWAGVLLTMYLVINTIVGIMPQFPPWALWVGGISILLVFGFTVKPSELKARGAELGMLPLNIMSALGDIISYVRLFAVGLASAKVAENFNEMSVGLVADADSWWLKGLMALAMVLILLLGHGLNLMMAGLSILVHAVRLNTLEFSNHKGITWSGYDFNPFRRTRRRA